MTQWMLAIWGLAPLPFLNPACTSRSSWFMYCWNLAWRILSTTLLACEMSTIVWWKWKMKVAQSYLALFDPMDYKVHVILQARMLEWVAFPFSSGSFWPRNQTRVSCIAGRFFTSWVTRESLQLYGSLNILWHCPSLGLEWKLTFSSPVAIVEFSKFVDILSAAL